MQDTLEDIKLYLRDEGLYDHQIKDFLDSHDITTLDEDEAWEIVEMHVFRDLDSVDLDAVL